MLSITVSHDVKDASSTRGTVCLGKTIVPPVQVISIASRSTVSIPPSRPWCSMFVLVRPEHLGASEFHVGVACPIRMWHPMAPRLPPGSTSLELLALDVFIVLSPSSRARNRLHGGDAGHRRERDRKEGARLRQHKGAVPHSKPNVSRVMSLLFRCCTSSSRSL